MYVIRVIINNTMNNRTLLKCSVFLVFLFAVGLAIIVLKWCRQSRSGINDYNDYESQFNGSNLIAAFVVFRHGDRTPTDREIASYPSFTKEDHPALFPYGLGALTQIGKRKSYQLGKNFRNRYRNLISDIYLPEEIYCRSSDMERTQMSMQLMLAGLYPPTGVQKWSQDNIKWQPIPYVIKKEDELRFAFDCPKYLALREKSYDLPGIKEQIAAYSDVIKLFANKTGNNFDNYTVLDVYYTISLFKSLENIKINLPKWADDIRSRLPGLSNLVIDMLFYTNETLKYFSGPFLNEILSNMKNIAQGSRKTKLFLYSAHDVTTAGLMKAVAVFKTHEPKYSASFALELRKRPDNENYEVFAVYTPDINGPSRILKMEGCSNLGCGLDELIKLKENITWTLEEEKKHCFEP